MRKDIIDPEVEDISIAAIPLENEETDEKDWYIFLINRKTVPIENVLVSSKGYGQLNNQRVETSELRHYVATIPPNGFARIEPIMPELFGISNQYWVSFYIGSQIFDKKYIFVAESIQESNMTEIPLIGKKGVLLS